MANKPDDDVVAENTVSKWRTLVRQQSTKVTAFAENIVLPKNERITRQISRQLDVPANSGIPTEKRAEHFPFFMIAISLAQIFIFYSFDVDALYMKFAYDPYRRHEIWRFFTPMFVHDDWGHLWGNLVMQLILGVFLEIVHEWKRIAVIYVASALGGGLCVTVLDNTLYSVGASDAVMGLLFAHVSTIILNWNEMDRKFSRFFCIALYIIHDVASDVYMEFQSDERSDISHAAHFGGAVTGFLVGILVLKNFKKHPWEDTLQKICIGVLLALVVVIIAINVTLPDYYPISEWNFDYKKTYYDDDDDESTTIYGEDV